MRTDEILQNATTAVITNDNLFEMANLRQHQTGVPGTIYISTAQGPDGPRVKHLAGRPGNNVPCIVVSVGSVPHVIEVNGVSDRDANALKDEVIAWVHLSHAKLLRFWFDGTTWFNEEVNAFKRSLKRIGQKRRSGSRR